MPLQKYKCYTVDYRLKQFRRVYKSGRIDFIEFNSDEGDRILCRMIKDNVLDLSKYDPFNP